MFFLLGGNEKKTRKAQAQPDSVVERVKELFNGGKFPVVTTDRIEGKEISKVLGLVCSRGYDSDEAFFGMASRAVTKGAHAIVGYVENVAFHPDGSKYFSCYGTAVMFDWEPEERYGAAALLNRKRTAISLDSEDTAAVRSSVRTAPVTETQDSGLELSSFEKDPPLRQWRSQ
ncbi:MAG: hypothetical protein RR317_06275 [Bilophila sp.]